MDGVTYKVKEAKDDAFATVIEKHGDVVEFTPVDMLNEQHQLEKLIKELTAKLEMEAMKQKNIEENHPFVKEMSLQDLFTAHMYYESISFAKGLPPKLQEFKEQLEVSKAEYERIANELGLDILPKAPEEVVDAAVEKIVGPETDNGKEDN